MRNDGSHSVAGGGVPVSFGGVGLVYDDGAKPLAVLDGLSFAVEGGQSVALIGPSGCGKSTILRLAAGLLAPTSGSVGVAGAPVARPRQETALIPQDLGLFPWKSVLQNAMLGLTVRKMSRPEAERRAREALSQVGLDGFERAFPKELSGGMRQRLALARALAMEADLVLMDEPLSAVDALLRESLQDALLDLWQARGHTQLIVTHSIEEAVFLGQRVLVFGNRPATLVREVESPGVGREGWRDSAEFARIGNEVRTALAQGGLL